MSDPLPIEEDIVHLKNKIRSKGYVYLVSLADAVLRYGSIVQRKNNVNYLKWTTMSLLIVRGGSMTLTDIAKYLFRSGHNITNIIDSLENDHCVIRQAESKDRRKKTIQITEEGVRLIDRSLYEIDTLWEPILESLNDDEFKFLAEIARKLRSKIVDEIEKYENEKG